MLGLEKELTVQEERELRRISDTIILKDDRSPERLLNETALFLHDQLLSVLQVWLHH